MISYKDIIFAVLKRFKNEVLDEFDDRTLFKLLAYCTVAFVVFSFVPGWAILVALLIGWVTYIVDRSQDAKTWAEHEKDVDEE